MNLFEQSSSRSPKKNKFNLSHEKKLTLNMGTLVPMLVQEVVPGDSFRVNSQVFVRFLALIAPIMHKVDVSCFYFFVPNRLIWANWTQWITGGEDGLSAISYPKFNIRTAFTTSNAFARDGSLLDYLGFPTVGLAEAIDVSYAAAEYSALPLRAYQLIYDQYFRNENVEVSQLGPNFMSDGSMAGVDYNAMFTLRQSMWEKDFFTSALPWTQRGAEVSLPINVTVPTTGIPGGNIPFFRNYATGAKLIPAASAAVKNQITDGQLLAAGASGDTVAYYDPNGSLSATNLTINALRLSVRLQEWLEKNARGGGRYVEVLLMHFGVLSSDARLQRVEYLGGGKQPVIISEVLTTGNTAGGVAPGTMAGHGMSLGGNMGFTKSMFEEHGQVMGILRIKPKTSYQNFMPYYWGRLIRTDYYWPSFAHLGEAPVRNFNVWNNFNVAGAAADGTIFGYQSRYAEYKFNQDAVHGQFKTALSFWHLGRIFAAAPALNTAFVAANPRSDIFAVSADVHHVIVQIFHSIDAVRPMPYFGVPEL